MEGATTGEEMPDYTYLIIGGGMTAAAAVAGIREVDQQGSIGVIGAEPDPPYDRPPLSKGLWKDQPLESIWRKTDGRSVTFHLGRMARELDPRSKRVTDDQGAAYTFGKLLLATGCTPRRLPFGGDQMIYYRTVDDYRRLRGLGAWRPLRRHRWRVHRLGSGRSPGDEREESGVDLPRRGDRQPDVSA